MLSRPKVRGVLLLKSRNYRDDPIMDPKYFEDLDKSDVRVMVEGMPLKCDHYIQWSGETNQSFLITFRSKKSRVHVRKCSRI